MADIRVKVEKNKAELVKALRAGDGSTGTFQTYVDIVIFAASLGIQRNKYIPVKDASRKDPDPIPWEHFVSRSKNQISDLIAISRTKNPKILENDDELEAERVEIFEGYANGGLSIIEDTLQGASDFTSQILLLLSSARTLTGSDGDIFNIDFLEA